MEKEAILEYVMVAVDVLRYMAESEKDKGEEISLAQAYEDMLVPEELRMTEKEMHDVVGLYINK